MTSKTFWTIILRITGLYLAWQFTALIPQFLSAFIYFGQDKLQGIATATILVFEIAVYALMLYSCFFKTDLVIEKLNLEKGLEDEKFEINVHRSVVLKIIVVVLGGIFVVDAFPSLFQNLFTYFQLQASYDGFKHNRSSPWIVYAFLKLVIGFFMMADSRLIVNFIERRRKG
ncbi:hypothetical protein SAMN05421821_106114 [Mucilaginibacter lappiensis]|uniref:Uncharacterized protein n=1 Tax=Mucilaginibacter lappiensis TaxID=354630 RepID=A0ABR6PKQ0_9SPHI|nr:hypothetical protein [Mucilaginibacter lappiensis]MBB6110305.1 hypothetical protein [Mucilaginibacter lappiensis]SIR29881.1 hypothetical protein SAMN05421821_106114 [Mucilaginibacter lappiensis]